MGNFTVLGSTRPNMGPRCVDPPKIPIPTQLGHLRRFVEQHRDALCLRQGSSLQGKLRQKECTEEKKWYNFLASNSASFTPEQHAQVLELYVLCGHVARMRGAVNEDDNKFRVQFHIGKAFELGPRRQSRQRAEEPEEDRAFVGERNQAEPG